MLRLNAAASRSFLTRCAHVRAQLAASRPSHCLAASQHSCSPVEPRAAYVHMPFCKRKCYYCDFPVQAVGSSLDSQLVQLRMQQYVDAVCHEIELMRLPGRAPMDSIYFGGGTPSLVPVAMVEQVLDALRRRLGIHPDAEISLEADPGTFDDAKLAQYIGIGVTRISMGVQSFQQELLEACGRSHGTADVQDAIRAVRGSGIRSWSLDLISGLPKLDMARWRHSLQEAIKAGPDHISVYDLQVEEGTPFARWHEQGKLSFPKDDEAVAMYAEAVNLLTSAGYEHYEVSNYAKPGHRSRHNQVYWRGVPYYAFGVGAASYVEGARFSRPAKIQKYLEWVEAGCEHPATPSESKEDAMLDTVMLRLRTADGLDMSSFAVTYGNEAARTVLTTLQAHVQRRLVEKVPRLLQGEGQHTAGEEWDFRLRLSDPDGFLLSNDVISDVFAAFSFDSLKS